MSTSVELRDNKGRVCYILDTDTGYKVEAFLALLDRMISMYGITLIEAFTCDADNDIFNCRIDGLEYEIKFIGE